MFLTIIHRVLVNNFCSLYSKVSSGYWNLSKLKIVLHNCFKTKIRTMFVDFFMAKCNNFTVHIYKHSVFGICMGLSTYPDPAFYLQFGSGSDSNSQINTDPCECGIGAIGVLLISKTYTGILVGTNECLQSFVHQFVNIALLQTL
jgi:hypothetical protein